MYNIIYKTLDMIGIPTKKSCLLHTHNEQYQNTKMHRHNMYMTIIVHVCIYMYIIIII